MQKRKKSLPFKLNLTTTKIGLPHLKGLFGLPLVLGLVLGLSTLAIGWQTGWLPKLLRPQTTESAVPSWEETVRVAIAQKEYLPTLQKPVGTKSSAISTPAETKTTTAHFANRAQNLRAYISAGGYSLQPRQTETKNATWNWQTRLSSLSRGEESELEFSPEVASTPTFDPAQPQVTIQHPGVKEWFVNTQAGIRQNFTIAERPIGSTDHVRLELALDTNLQLLESSDTSLTFGTNSTEKLIYSDLLVTDAQGKKLPANMKATRTAAGKYTVQIAYTDTDAIYPVLIDPLSTTPDTTVETNQASASISEVANAGDLNEDSFRDVIVGVPLYDNGENNEGVAFIFYGSASGISTTPDITLEVNQAGAQFGHSVSAVTDVNGDTFADIMVSARYYDDGQTNEGGVFIFYGDGAGITTTPDVILQVNQDGASFGIDVAASDVNGDSISDLIVGAMNYNNGQSDEGAVFVFNGSGGGPSSSPDVTIESNQAGALLGKSVANAGDVDNDSYEDIIIGADHYDNGSTDEGVAFIHYGSVSGVSASPDVTLEQDQATAFFGGAVAGAGDINFDGYDDVLVGATGYDNSHDNEGAVFVYYGTGSGISTTEDVQLENNQAGSGFGVSVAGAGDINFDTYGDVLVGAWKYDNGQVDEGAVYVYEGTANGLPSYPSYILEQNTAGIQFGTSLSTAGDVNADSFADIIVGAGSYTNGEADEGVAFVFHGGATAPNFVVAEVGGTTTVVESSGNDDTFTVALTTQPTSDVVVLVTSSDTSSVTVDQSSLTFSNADWDIPQTLTVTPVEDADTTSETPTINLVIDDANSDDAYDSVADLPVMVQVTDSEAVAPNPAITTMLEVNQAEAEFGKSVSTVLDVNGDGYDDVAVGAPLYDDGESEEGVVFVYYGSASGVSTTPDATLQINQANANFGLSVANAGDVNNDTYDDLIVGAPYYDDGENNEGAAFIFYGSGGGISTSPDTTLQINQANANFGNSVATAGNVNADSYQDVVVGAPGYDNGEADEGGVFVFHGSGSGVSASPDASLEIDVAGAFFGTSVASAGDVNFDTYSDVIAGAQFYANGSIDEGGAFVFHGSGAGVSTSPDTTLEINVANSYFGTTVASAGDVNNDTYADVVVGAYGYTNGQSGEGGAFVFHGSGAGVSTSPDTTLEINQAGANLGISVASAGDINNDTYDDLLVGATTYSSGQQYEGAVFVYNGSGSGVSTTADLTIQSNQPGAEVGVSVASAGNVNNDTYSDVIIGSRVYDSGELNEGAVFIYHGSASGLVPAPGITVTESSGSTAVSEGGATDSFTVVLDAQPATDVVLTVDSSDTSSVTVDQATLTFTNANWDSAQTVTVTAPVDGDTDNETPTITIAVDDASSDDDYDAVANEVVNVAVTDAGGSPGFTITQSGGTTAATEGSTDSFTVVLTSQPSADVIIGFTNSDTTSTSYDTNNLTFTNGNWNSPQTVTVTAEQDIDLVSEVVTITLAIDDDNSDNDYDAVANQTVTFTITDNDVTLVGTEVTESSGTTAVTEGGATDSFSFALTVQPSTDVVFNVTSSDATSMTVSPATLTFTNGNWSTPQDVTVTAPEDVDATSETPTVSLAVNDGSSDDAYDPLPTVAVNVAVTDNEAASPVTPVRGTAEDLWADLVLGQESMSEIGIYETTNQSMWLPHGVVVDTNNASDNKMYVYDSGNNRILGYDVEDCLANAVDPLNCTPEIVIGQPGYTTSACNGDGAFQSYPTRAAATASTLCTQEEGALSPGESESGASMDIDAAGNLYVTDFYNHRVLKYNSPFTTDQVADQVWGQSDFTGVLCNRGGSATNNTFCFSWGDSNNWTAGVDIDSSGNLWVVDSGNNRVLRFPESGGSISSTADLVLGQPDFSSTGYGASLDQLRDPNVVRVLADGTVYVSDSYNSRILRYTTPTTGEAGSTFGSGFNYPHGIDFDPTESGRIWIANRGDNTVELWDLTGENLIETVGVNGNNNIIGDGSGSIGIDSNGNMFVANGIGALNNTVNVFTQGGSLTDPTYSLIAATTEGNVISDDELASVYGVAVSNDQLIVVDEARILFWNIPNGISDLSTGKAADGYIGTSSMNTRAIECCRELKADTASHIYTSTTRNDSPAAQRIIKIYEAPLTSGESPTVTLEYPFNLLGGGTLTDAGNNYEFSGLQPTPNGDFLWVSDHHLNRVFRIRNPLTTPVVDVVLGQVDASGTSCNQGGSISDTTLCNPGGIALDAAGNLYVSDQYLENEGNRRLLRFDAGTFPTDNASVIYTQVPDAITTNFAAWTPSFDLLNQYMVVGHNPYYDIVDSILVPNGRRFPSVFYTPTVTPLDADEYLRDYFSMGIFSAFDDDNNLYIGDLNRSRLLVYNAPFGSTASPTPTPSPSPTVNTGTIEFRYPTGLITNTKPTFTFRKSTNTNGGVGSYNVTVDSGKNNSFFTTGIPASGNGTSDYVWKDDDRVKIVYRNEQDNDASNDEIDVYFKGYDHYPLAQGQHRWSVDIVNTLGVLISHSVGFQVDTTQPTANNLNLVSIGSFTPNTAFAVNPGNRTPIITGNISDLFVGGPTTNENQTTDTFDLTNGKPNQVVLIIDRLINGTSPTDPFATFTELNRTTATLSQQTQDADQARAQFSVTPPFPLLDSWYRLTLEVKDEAGNTNIVGPVYIRYDAFGTYFGPINLGGTIPNFGNEETTAPTEYNETDETYSTATDSATLDTTVEQTATGSSRPDTDEKESTGFDAAALVSTLVNRTGKILGAAWQITRDTVEPTVPYLPGTVTMAAAATTTITTAAVAMAVVSSTQTPFSWSLVINVLEALGLIAQRKPRGLAFGTKEFEPIPFGLITLVRQKLTPTDPDIQETVVTDVHGIYRGIHLPPGTYTMALAHQNYRFPTAQNRPQYQTIQDFYRGEPFGVSNAKSEQFFAIPADPTMVANVKLGFKQGWRWMVTHLRFSKLVVPFMIITLLSTIIHPSILNLTLSGLYLVSFAFQLKTWLAKPAVKGTVKDSIGNPIAGAMVRLNNLAANELAAIGLTDDNGNYQLFAPKGVYQIMVSRVGYVPKEDALSSLHIDTTKGTQVADHTLRTASVVYAELGLA